MADSFTLTGWLIVASGLYSAAAGAGMLLSPDRFRKMFAEMENSPALNYVAGLVVFTIGVTILLVHPTSARWPDIIVAILGWGALAEGLTFLAAPHIMWLIARPFLRAYTRLWGGIAVAFGVALIVIGWSEIERMSITSTFV